MFGLLKKQPKYTYLDVQTDLEKAVNKYFNAEIPETPESLTEPDEVKILIQLGFTENQKVKDFENQRDVRNNESKAIRDKRKILEALAKWQDKLPGCKIIHNDDLDRIAKKYGLKEVSQQYFKSEIPAKNLQDIIQFYKVCPANIAYNLYEIDSNYPLGFRKINQYDGKEVASVEDVARIAKDFKDRMRLIEYHKHFSRNMPDGTVLPMVNDPYGIRDGIRDGDIYKCKKDLSIYCLPKDISPKYWKDKQEEENKQRLLREDPIITLALDNQFSVLITAWGPEAEDANQLSV